MRLFALLWALAIGSTLGALSQEIPKGHASLVNLSQPVYPLLARQANIQGDVSLTVTVFSDGKTQTAFESGHAMFREAALDSAQQSRFECPGCHLPVAYHLIYSFRLVRGTDCCTAKSVPPKVVIEPPSSQENEHARTLNTITADEICLCDPNFELTKRRSLKCLYLWRCS